jgi:hypothetical protein
MGRDAKCSLSIFFLFFSFQQMILKCPQIPVIGVSTAEEYFTKLNNSYYS